MKKIGLLFVLCLLCAASASAQAFRITGRVTDANDGSPLVGATVMVVGTATATSTDAQGAYAIQASKGDVISFTYVGKAAQKTPVNARTVIDIRMEDDASTLNDVVVIGYGTMKKRDLTGAVTSVKGDNLIKGNPALSVNSALQGKVAGVQINASAAGISGYRQFEYPFIARAEGTYDVEPVEFSYFDPARMQYMTLRSRPLELEITPDAKGGGGDAYVVQGRGMSKEEVKMLGQDIRFIKLGNAQLRPVREPFLFGAD